MVHAAFNDKRRVALRAPKMVHYVRLCTNFGAFTGMQRNGSTGPNGSESADFDAWPLKERQAPTQQLLRGATRYVEIPRSGAVFRAAEALKNGKRVPRAK